MARMLEEISTITAKGQTTVPRSVRRALGLDLGGKIAFRIDERGVSVHRPNTAADDPAIASFLDFLARDIQRRPEAIEGLSPVLAARVAAFTQNMEIDLDEEIDGEVSI